MRLDWIFLPRENPCAKFYIIIIIIIMIRCGEDPKLFNVSSFKVKVMLHETIRNDNF